MSLARNILGGLLTFAFIFVGVNKITPLVNPALHAELVGKSHSWAELFKVKEFGLNSDQFLLLIGAVEATGGLLLLTPLGSAATFLLIAVMVGATYTEIQTQGPVAGSLILLALLVVYHFVRPSGDKHHEKKRQ